MRSTNLQGRQSDQHEDHGNNPEAHNDARFRPAFQFKVVMQRRHVKYSPPGKFVGSHLQDHRHGLHHEHARHHDKHQFLANDHGNQAQRGAHDVLRKESVTFDFRKVIEAILQTIDLRRSVSGAEPVPADEIEALYGAGWQSADYTLPWTLNGVPTPREDNIREFGLSLLRRVGRHGRLGVTAIHTTRTSTIPGADYSRWRIGLQGEFVP